MRTIDDLAIFGGEPTFAQPLHVGRPNIGDCDQLMARISDILERRWLTNDGPYVQEFEQRLADITGAKHCIAVNNATIGLELAIRALDLSGEVIVPSNTFVATAHALQWQEIVPVFCDIDPATHNLDPHQVERMITPRTTGIIGVHVWGRACAVEELTEIAERRNLRLLFDAAHAFGCSYKGQMIGNFGNVEVFSFHATKFLNSLEGGAVVTNDDDLATKIRLMRNFGFTDVDQVEYIGINGKMNELSAAMGVTSLESMDSFIELNYRNYRQYQEELQDVPGVSLILYDEAERNNYQYIALEIDQEQTLVSRDTLVWVLWEENVRARRYFYPGCHRMEPYVSYYPHAGLLLPETEGLVERIMTLPTGTSVSSEEIAQICEIIRQAIASGWELQERVERLAKEDLVAYAD